jgi:adenylate cyclase
MSMNAIWEPCFIRRKIVRNNRTLDRAVGDLAQALGVKLSDENLANDDVAGRLARVVTVQKDEMYAGWRDQYRSMKPEELDKDGRIFLAAVADIDSIRNESVKLQKDLRNSRAALLAELQGKALLIGFTATGNEDAVATSIHGRCPGVIAHGVVFNSIMTGQFWTAPPRWISFLITAILGVLTALLAGRLNWQMAFLVVGAMAATVILFNGLYLFDNQNLLLDLASPLIALTSVWIACSVVRIYMETIERKRVERRFRSYVDPDIVNAYMERGDAATAGESRELTVAFTDLAGFTTLSERLGEKTVPMLNDYLDRMVPLIYEKHGIMKFLGDGIMFFYGAPKPNPDHATDAVLTALQMQKALAAFNEDLAAKNLPTLSLRIGINTGLMVVGDAGSRDPIQRHEYTVLGDAVNFASRLEGANKYTGTDILISARTAQLCGDKFLLRPVGAIQVAGKVEAVLCFEVCGLADAADDHQRNLCTHTRYLVEHFRGRQFESVLKLADQLDLAHGPSKLTSIYRDLAESYLTNPPEQSFDGRIEFESK